MQRGGTDENNKTYFYLHYLFEPTWYNWQNLVPAFDDYFGYDIQGLWRVWKAGGFTHEGIKVYLDKAFADMGAEWWKAMFRGGKEAGND